ncbi:MAG: DUF1127 domain-containing protein [Rhodomicrobiaceae bacterium]
MITMLTKGALRWMEEHRRRAELRALLKYDDKMLDDIGLVRAEILAALELPVETDAIATARSRSEKAQFPDRCTDAK